MPASGVSLARVAVASVLTLGVGCGRDPGPPEPDNITVHVAGTVTDRENGAPLPGLTVYLHRPLESEHLTETTSDEAGRYELSLFVKYCIDGGTGLYFGIVSPCYSLLGEQVGLSPGCTEAPQAFDLPLYRSAGVPGCP